MPASNLKAIEKARTLACDAIVLDLEDAVAPEMKAMARDQAAAAIRTGGFGDRELVIRINGLDTEWGEADLVAACAAGPDAILAPKVNDAADVQRYSQGMASAPERTGLWTMIETARSVFRLEEIAGAAQRSRLSGWVMGVNDLAKEMGAELDAARIPFLPVLTLAVAAAKSSSLFILDGVYNDLEDADGLEAQCRQARAFGFDGKTLIHPNQVAPANAVFSPTAEELSFADAVIEAFAQPENTSRGVIRVNGRMAERLHLAQSVRLVAVAQAIADAEAGRP
jgi:citrate lyase subunit beta/citryl-CoA lyase